MYSVNMYLIIWCLDSFWNIEWKALRSALCYENLTNFGGKTLVLFKKKSNLNILNKINNY